jgi:hypothetical protein
MIAFMTWNLYDYEFVRQPPEGLPDMGFTIYITDSDENQSEAMELGWDIAYKTDKFKGITDKFKKRNSLSHIICYPEEVLDLRQFDSVFMFDSNVMVMPLNYTEFVKDALDSECAFYCSSHVYSGERDTVEAELAASHQNARWSYNFEAMDKYVGKYITLLKSISSTPSIVFAKYIGWNLKNPMKDVIADYIFHEEHKHLQGNIVLTMASVLFKSYIFNYKLEYMNNNWMAHIAHHRYDA